MLASGLAGVKGTVPPTGLRAAATVMRSHAVQFAGRKVTDVLPHAWDDRARFDMYVDALEHNEVRQIERQSEADGNTSWYHIVASPLDGDLAIWFADFTRRKQQERGKESLHRCFLTCEFQRRKRSRTDS